MLIPSPIVFFPYDVTAKLLLNQLLQSLLCINIASSHSFLCESHWKTARSRS